MNIRLLTDSDDLNQYMDIVRDLNSKGVILNDESEMIKVLNSRSSNIETYGGFLGNTMISTATMIFENKIRYKNLCCHIEDVAVDSSYRGLGYGKMIVNHCLEVAKEKDCYKVKLCCSDKNVSFYEQFGFIASSNGMEIVL